MFIILKERKSPRGPDIRRSAPEAARDDGPWPFLEKSPADFRSQAQKV
jgi:hypothetical protein